MTIELCLKTKIENLNTLGFNNNFLFCVIIVLHSLLLVRTQFVRISLAWPQREGEKKGEKGGREQ